MGLITGIYGMVRQSEQDELNKRVTEQRLAMDAVRYRKEMDAYSEMMRKREQVYGGLGELAEIDTRIAENNTRRSFLQQDSQRIADPAERSKAELQIMLLDKENQRLDRLSRVREAQMHYDTIAAGMGKAKALDVADAVNGIRTRNDSGMATIRKKIPAGVDPDTNEQLYDEVTYKAPYSQIIGDTGSSTAKAGSYYSSYDQSIGRQFTEPNAASVFPNTYSADQSARRADYVNSEGSVMFSSGQPEISAPSQPVMTTTNVQPAKDLNAMRAEAEKILNNPNIPPDKKQKVRERVSQFGITL